MSQEIKPWHELSREIVFQKYSRKIEKVIYKLPNGEESDFYIKKEGSSVGILALTKDNQVILVRQFRPGPNEVIDDLPGGYVEKDESVVDAAARELLEETGFKGNIEFVSSGWTCAYSTAIRNYVVATDCEKVADQTLDSTEFAEVVLVSLAEFKDNLKRGKCTYIEAGYAGLHHLGLL